VEVAGICGDGGRDAGPRDGATTAIFTMFDQVLLRVLPVERPQELVRLNWHGVFRVGEYLWRGHRGLLLLPDVQRPAATAIRCSAECWPRCAPKQAVSWRGQAADERAEVVSGNYFQVLGLRPFAGRLFNAADETGERMRTPSWC